jgi:predicted nucleotidyltransferase
MVIYGSHARRQANVASDVDVLLLYAAGVSRGAEITRLSPILSDLNLRYQVLISVLPCSQTEYEGTVSPFWNNVRREGVSLDAI